MFGGGDDLFKAAIKRKGSTEVRLANLVSSCKSLLVMLESENTHLVLSNHQH